MRLLWLTLICLALTVSPMLSQFGGSLPFGKNKVQYQDFSWKYIQTENFDVYFHEGGLYSAKFAALRAEKALKEIEATLSYSITKRIIFVIYNSHNQFQQTNVLDDFLSEGIGGVTELLKNRVVIPFEGDYKKFGHVVHHELVHAVLNDMFYGGSIQALINSGSQTMIPLWMNEGFAEYSAAGGLDIPTDEFMRDLSVSEYLRGLNQLNGYLAYRGGQTFWWYVAEKYGKGKIGEVFNRLRSNGDVNSTFKSSFGMTYEEMSEQWAKDLKKFYFPDVDKYDYVEDYSQRLTNHQKEDNFYNSSPAISPDGEHIAYLSDRDGVFGIYVMNITTKKIRKIRGSARSSDFEELNFLTPGISWNPDGTMIAVGAKSGGEDVIYMINVASNDYEKLDFDIKTLGSVHWSPDGKTLLFDASKNGQQSDLFLYTIGTKTLQQLTNDVFTDYNATWSSDSKIIYFISDRGDSTNGLFDIDRVSIWKHGYKQRDIFSLDLETTTIKRITFSPGVGKQSIAVSPDNSSLLFVADYNGIGNLWELKLASNQLTARTNSLQEVSQISLSKDGTKLVFSSQNRVGYDLFMLKYPFDQKERDTLPLTKFRQQEIAASNMLMSIMNNDEVPSDTSNTSYGSVDVDFSQSAMVHPNEDVKEPPIPGDQADSAMSEDFVPKDYKITFSRDVVIGNAGYSNWFGAQGTIQALFSDVLGDHSIYAQANLYIDLTNSNFYIQYRYLPKIVDYSVAAFQNAGFTYIATSAGQELFRLRNYGIALGASYPLSKFMRFDAGSQIMNMSRDKINGAANTSLNRFVIVPSVSYVIDNTLNGMWAPISGERVNITVEGSPKLSSSGLGFATLRTDMREYVHLGGMYSFVLRGSGGISIGANPQKFFVGGVDNWLNRSISTANGWPFVNPEDFAFTRPGWPLRGWALNERNGSRYFVTNAELRFPLLFAFQAGPIPALFQGLQGQFFLDAGGAFNDKNEVLDFNGDPVVNPILWSTGIGIRSVALGLPLRIDVAWRREPTGIFSSPYWLFSLGADF